MMKKITCFLLVLISCLIVTGCGSFFSEESEIVQIAKIDSEILPDGSQKMIIYYTDEEKKPDEFIIPAGTQGNGIQTILSTKTENGAESILKIFFTDENMAPVEFRVTNGVSVSGVSYEEDDEGNIFLVVNYSDGTSSEPMLLPKGEDGEDGNSFTGYDQVVNEDKSLTVYFHFTKTEDVVITIPAPQKGDTGNGIRSIIGIENETEYILVINYDNDTSEEVKFTRPKDPNTWYSGSTVPSSAVGKSGDYYFDIYHNDIYIKEGNSWTVVIDFDSDDQSYVVRFNLNDSDSEPAQMPIGAQLSYNIKRGAYFTSDGYDIPVPTRNGYTFKGWYTSRIVSPVTGQFTDLTPVFSDITLYAIWEKNN